MRTSSSAAARDGFDLDGAVVEMMSRGAVRVPPYPAVALKVNTLVRREDYGLEELTKLVASDQALAADTLRCANSSFYSRGAPVSTLSRAISRIGGREMARLAMASGLGVHARKPGPLSVLKRRTWLDALAAAVLVQEVARKRGLDPEEAFVCGLLHDFGRMVAIACFEEVVDAYPRARPLPIEYWVERVDRYHVELGQVLAARWDLPQIVADTISLHHAEDWRGAAEPRMVELVTAADEVVRLLGSNVYLTAEDLGTVSLLTAPECELVSRVLERLPGFIAAFEDGAPPPQSGVSLVESATPSHEPIGDPAPASFPVQVTVHRLRREYRATGITSTNLLVQGREPLPENVLMQLELKSAPPLACWATAKLSWPDAGGHAVLLQPFALDGEAHQRWIQLTGGAAA